MGPKMSSGLISCCRCSARTRFGDLAHPGSAACFCSCATSSSESEYSESMSGNS